MHPRQSQEQLHQITRSAKISAAVIAHSLGDLNDPELHDDAKRWLEQPDNASISVKRAAQALANINIYLHNYGLDALPVDKNAHWEGVETGAPSAPELPLTPTDADGWLNAIHMWGSESTSPQDRTKLADQLIDLVDQQVKVCYQHMRREIIRQAVEKDLVAEPHDYDDAELADDYSLPGNNGPLSP